MRAESVYSSSVSTDDVFCITAEDIKTELLDLGILEVLIPLTNSPSVEVQGNSAAAIGNLSSKTDDYSAFSAVWTEPEGGLHGYLVRFLESDDTTFQHIAIWTLVQLLESQGDLRLLSPSCGTPWADIPGHFPDATLEQHIRSSKHLLPLVSRLSSAPLPPSDASVSSGADDDDAGTDGGEREIVELARTAMELIEEGSGEGGQGQGSA